MGGEETEIILARGAKEMTVATDTEIVVIGIAAALDHQTTVEAIAGLRETSMHTLQVAATAIGNARTDTHRRATVGATVNGTVTEALTAEMLDVTMTRGPTDETEMDTTIAEEEDEESERGVAMMGLQGKSSHGAARRLRRNESPLPI